MKDMGAVTGQPWGNGPMSVFGALGWIWLLMAKPDPVERATGGDGR